jgi:hypothetical protein
MVPLSTQKLVLVSDIWSDVWYLRRGCWSKKLDWCREKGKERKILAVICVEEKEKRIARYPIMNATPNITRTLLPFCIFPSDLAPL